MLKTLDKFKIGEKGVITHVGGEGRLRRRLFDMGVTPGAEVFLRKLRKTEACLVTLIVSEDDQGGQQWKDSR